MSIHCSTIERIVILSAAEQALLSGDWSEEDRQACAEIQAELAALWPKRRAELVFEREGPPRLVSAPDPRSVRQVARGIAHGIQPLPSGGD